MTIKELFEGEKPVIPLVDPTAFKRGEGRAGEAGAIAIAAGSSKR